MEEARTVVRAQVAADKARFIALADAAGLAYSLYDIAVPISGSVEEILQHCRLSDLVVVAKSAAKEQFRADLIRQLLLDSAAPVFIVPPRERGSSYDRALIAWDGRSVAAHAMHSALPLLQLANNVTIVRVVPPGSPSPGSADLSAYLQRHGISAEHRDIVATGSVADSLLAFISEERIDWITMGAFSRSRVSEILFGSPTREMLGETTVPVLMHH